MCCVCTCVRVCLPEHLCLLSTLKKTGCMLSPKPFKFHRKCPRKCLLPPLPIHFLCTEKPITWHGFGASSMGKQVENAARNQAGCRQSQDPSEKNDADHAPIQSLVISAASQQPYRLKLASQSAPKLASQSAPVSCLLSIYLTSTYDFS